MSIQQKISIVGGCGRVGLPLGLALSRAGFQVTLVDTDEIKVNAVNKGEMPFAEIGADELLSSRPNVRATKDKSQIVNSDVIIFVTRQDTARPDLVLEELIHCLDEYLDWMHTNQLIVLRSTLPPGACEKVHLYLQQHLSKVQLAYCPERIAQGHSLKEMLELPQFIAGNSVMAKLRAGDIFGRVCSEIIPLSFQEAEYAKLMCNAWRYLEFAIANQFYMTFEKQNISAQRVFDAVKKNYPRMSRLPSPGLTAGPCLRKDTEILVQANADFSIGSWALAIHQQMPKFLVQQLEEKIPDLSQKKIALLGLTFKANSDDTRESLSFEVQRILNSKGSHVIVVDPHVSTAETLSSAVDKADAFILCTPHDEFQNLKTTKPIVDCWGFYPELT